MLFVTCRVVLRLPGKMLAKRLPKKLWLVMFCVVQAKVWALRFKWLVCFLGGLGRLRVFFLILCGAWFAWVSVGIAAS